MISWNDLLDNLKGEVQDKSKNPFFGAFIATWIIRHWELVFILFNFDEEFELDAKLDRLKCYFDSLEKGDFWWTIAYTFGVIILGYILLNLARIISNFSDKIVTPFIYKWTAGKSTIVLKEVYNSVIEREKNLRIKLENETKEKLNLQSQIDHWEKMYGDLFEKFTESENNKVIEEKLNDGSIEKTKFDEKTVNGFAIAIWQKFSSYYIANFLKVHEKIKENIPMDPDSQDLLPFFEHHNLVKKIGNPLNNLSLYQITEIGEIILKFIKEKRPFN